MGYCSPVIILGLATIGALITSTTAQCTVASSTLIAAATYTSSSSFVYVNNFLTWDEANACCLSVFGGYLATITSLSQNTEILTAINQASGTSKWFGYYDPFELDDPNAWQFIDGTSSSFVRWHPNSPVQPDGQEFCGRLSLNTYWFDAPCNVASDFVCNVNQGN